MDNFWEEFKTNLRAGIKTVSRKTEELTKIGRIKLEMVSVKRDIEKAFIELGGRIYHNIDQEKKFDTKSDPEIFGLVTKIRGFEDKLEDLENRIKEIQDIEKSDVSEDL